MDLSIKEKLLIGVISGTLVLALGGSAWAIVSPKDTTNKGKDTTSKQDISTSSATTKNAIDSTGNTEAPVSQDSTMPKSSSHQTAAQSTNIQNEEQNKVTNNAQASTQIQPQEATCDETMKTSYTSLYNSQVTAEKANWSNQVNAWNNYASGNGMSFSGYTQSMINQHKPAHDVKLAQLQTQYQQKLASINCN